MSKHTLTGTMSDLESELKRTVDGEVRFDDGSRALYCNDASNYRYIPLGVVLPKTKESVINAVAACQKFGAPIVSRGGGTGLCGQTVNHAVVFDFSKYMNHILDIDPLKKTATVEPGVILDHLRDRAEEHTLTYGPDPATHNHCTLGGMIGNNSCGVHSVMAGRTVDNVLELEVLTYDGTVMRVGATPDPEIDVTVKKGGRTGEIYAKLKEIRDRYSPLIRERYPDIPRRVSGYNLDELLPENGFNVARCLVGSESTLIVVLEAKVRLVYSPPVRSLLVLGYPDVYHAGDHCARIMECGPVGLEGMDNYLVQFMQRKGLHVKDLPLLPPGNGWLLVEFGGATKDEADDKAKKCMDDLKKESDAPSMVLYDDKVMEKKIWKLRESGLGATANVPGLPLGWPGWEDAAVPPDKVGAYLRDFRKLLDRYEYICSLYGHFGQGCIHCRISFDLFNHDGIAHYMSFIDEASDLVVSYKGSFSAEHGDGQSKAIFLPKMYGPELIDAFRQLKTTFDPGGKMNPGKVVDPYRPDKNLRLGVNYRPWQADTIYRFPDDHQSFEEATLRCVGVGECRRTHDAFMCPSFLATREEKDTTRGRAHLLFEMFRGDLIKDGWHSREVLESLDLCLGCMGCKKECPVNVDMAMYKSEFMYHHYKSRIRPLKHYIMGHIGFWSELASHAPGFANFITNGPLFGSLTKRMASVAPERSFPRYADEPFHTWYARQVNNDTGRKKVCLYADAFNNYFSPDTLKALFYDLDRFGFDVVTPGMPLPAIRPLLHYGFLNKGKEELRRMIEILHPFYSAGIDIVFAEPSTATVFRDDLLHIFPTERDARRLKEKCFLLSEFIAARKPRLPKVGGSAVFHAHCHQKASLNPQSARDVLKDMGISAEEPWEGCCGMAGSFGYEHYDLSLKIAEESLLPAIRKADPSVRIIADGFSCRTQIRDGTGRHALHMAEVIQQGFEDEHNKRNNG
jgi:FAD/FMN-containing dehydrogenase/Fe-S oxidoreductase